MEEPVVDRAAMIENASRSLRQQMARAGNVGAAGRPRSKGPLHSGTRGQSQTGFNGRYQHAPDGRAGPGEYGRSENAQRRIRSAENQHRQVSTVPREGPHLDGQAAVWHPNSATPQFTSVAGPGAGLGPVDPIESELEVALEVFGTQGAATAGAATAGAEDEPPPNIVEFPQEMKRPASRKKDPSASAAVGLGNLNGPARMSDAFAESQRKTRQPIPVESWGPRPPSRAGVPQKSAPLDTGLDAHGDQKDMPLSRSRPGGPGPAAGRQAEKAQAVQASALGGTWARARQEPLGAGEARRGRQSRAGGPPGPHGRASPAGARSGPCEDHADLGVFGHGRPVNRQPVSKSTSGAALESHQLREAKASVQQTATPQSGAWSPAPGDSLQGVGALEVSGSHIGEPGTPAAPGGTTGLWCGSPPPRGAKGRYTPSAAEPVSVEDVEAPPESDLGLAPGTAGHRAGPQVVFNRTVGGPESRSRGDVRRSTVSDRGDQRAREGRGANRPIAFSTALDADFLSLFAS